MGDEAAVKSDLALVLLEWVKRREEKGYTWKILADIKKCYVQIMNPFFIYSN